MYEYFHNQKQRSEFCINDNVDLLVEILKRLDDRSLGVSACVCRLWCSITRDDSLWENLCFRQVSPNPSPIVVALGGYKRLYMVCVRPLLSRLGNSPRRRRLGEVVSRRDELVQLSMSLFCVDCYERLGNGNGNGNGNGGRSASGSSLLMFLCNKPIINF